MPPGASWPSTKSSRPYLRYSSSGPSKSCRTGRSRWYILSGRLGGETYTDLSNSVLQREISIVQFPDCRFALARICCGRDLTGIVNLDLSAVVTRDKKYGNSTLGRGQEASGWK